MKKISLVFMFALVFFAGCQRQSEVNTIENARAVADLTDSTISLAKSLAIINPRHSESYYRSMLIAIIQECTKKPNTESCIKSEVDALAYR
jgi:hypothetical protein